MDEKLIKKEKNRANYEANRERIKQRSLERYYAQKNLKVSGEAVRAGYDFQTGMEKIQVPGRRHPEKLVRHVPKLCLQPFMGVIRCFECSHRITGETLPKPGKLYIYYRRANKSCPAYHRRVRQEDLHSQLNKAFKPFACFTKKTVTMIIEQVKVSMDHLNAYTDASIQRLRKEVAETKEKMIRLGDLLKDGKISQAEHDDWMEFAHEKITDNSIEIAASCHADAKTFDHGLKIIQLLTKVSDYSKMEVDLMKKAELGKILLSNLLLKQGTLCYSYHSPLDDLITLAEGLPWWRLAGSNR